MPYFDEEQLKRIVNSMEVVIADRIEKHINTRIEALIKDTVKTEIRQLLLTMAELKRN